MSLGPRLGLYGGESLGVRWVADVAPEEHATNATHIASVDRTIRTIAVTARDLASERLPAGRPHFAARPPPMSIRRYACLPWFATAYGQASTTNDLYRMRRSSSSFDETRSVVWCAAAHAACGTGSRAGAALPFRRRTRSGYRRSRAVPRGRGVMVVVIRAKDRRQPKARCVHQEGQVTA
jgi:hypothetical protein